MFVIGCLSFGVSRGRLVFVIEWNHLVAFGVSRERLVFVISCIHSAVWVDGFYFISDHRDLDYCFLNFLGRVWVVVYLLRPTPYSLRLSVPVVQLI